MTHARSVVVALLFCYLLLLSGSTEPALVFPAPPLVLRFTSARCLGVPEMDRVYKNIETSRALMVTAPAEETISQ